MFIGGDPDFEKRQYRLQQCLKEYYGEFSRNRLYPAFRDLVDVTTALESLLERKEKMDGAFPQNLSGIDLQHNQLLFDSLTPSDPEFQRVIDLVEWALPLFRKAIEEAIGIYSFVEEHLSINEVGIMPVYKQEGYWTVPDALSRKLYLSRYEVSLFASSTERYRQLKTTVLEVRDTTAIHVAPESLKCEVLGKYRDLPNPAMYICDTDLEFPYGSTILPIAKRKLMARLQA
jgi:hypothetical protein